MEQAATSTSSLLASPTEDEIAVADILLNLKTTMLPLSESLPNCKWGLRRKRSCLVSPPSISASSNRIEDRKAPIKAEEARTTGSPDTPLIFSHSESDDKPKHSSKKTSKSKSKAREDYLDLIDEETKRKKLLTGEIAKVRKYYNELKETNRRLKAMKQEAMAKCGSVKSGEPRGFDLNLPAEEESGGVVIYWPLDDAADKRARSAEARRKRIRIIKTKSTRK
ncbi:uncharacterized protein LOC121755953 [Salvia splendens]|uniref:uncharacterized protein LOC121755953 n=1 Tax=Salvia splendens TaxID=180675 RepID=UPI001C26C954|nr:uncharacterized protein LOC121755953 [Salvia splendens]